VLLTRCPKPPGWDNAKRSTAARHIAVDTSGLILDVVVTAASVQTARAPGHCCGTPTAPAARVRPVWADAGYPARFHLGRDDEMTLQVVSSATRTLQVLPAAGSSSGPSLISKHRRTVRLNATRQPRSYGLVGHDRFMTGA
jgi:hypothetical protein